MVWERRGDTDLQQDLSASSLRRDGLQVFPRLPLLLQHGARFLVLKSGPGALLARFENGRGERGAQLGGIRGLLQPLQVAFLGRTLDLLRYDSQLGL